LFVLPGHKNLVGVNFELVDAENREFRLREALKPLHEKFNFIVIDCPPALDLLTLNSLVAADSVLITMQAEYFALEGISELLDTIERIRAAFNPSLEIEGVLLTMFDERTNLAQQVTAELKKFFGEKLLTTTIPRNVRLAEAPSHGKPVLLYDPKSRGAEAYLQLAQEIAAKRMPGFNAFSQLEKPEASQPTNGEEKQVVNAPRWRRWRDRNKLITMDLKG
jgi:chromosome partitioning protein